jgi:fructokinase
MGLMNQTTDNKRPIVFGEVLFDSFPDGNLVLGGAPFNVAWHLAGFGMEPLMVTCIGDDAAGDQVRTMMQDWGMDISGLQSSDQYPTGRVEVSFPDGKPSYDIVPDQAYDYINNKLVNEIKGSGEFSLIYHGSLALRNTESNETLDEMIASTQLPVFLDLNLRSPWWSHEQIEKLLYRATWLKLNDEELFEISKPAGKDIEALKRAASEILTQYRLERIIVTLGEYGAFVVGHDCITEGRPGNIGHIVDTVGAGDAFSSVMIMGLIKKWTISEMLDRALVFASAICQQQGATNRNHSLYQ